MLQLNEIVFLYPIDSSYLLNVHYWEIPLKLSFILEYMWKQSLLKINSEHIFITSLEFGILDIKHIIWVNFRWGSTCFRGTSIQTWWFIYRRLVQ